MDVRIREEGDLARLKQLIATERHALQRDRYRAVLPALQGQQAPAIADDGRVSLRASPFLSCLSPFALCEPAYFPASLKASSRARVMVKRRTRLVAWKISMSRGFMPHRTRRPWPDLIRSRRFTSRPSIALPM